MLNYLLPLPLTRLFWRYVSWTLPLYFFGLSLITFVNFNFWPVVSRAWCSNQVKHSWCLPPAPSASCKHPIPVDVLWLASILPRTRNLAMLLCPVEIAIWNGDIAWWEYFWIGSKNVKRDWLSRLPQLCTDIESVHNGVSFFAKLYITVHTALHNYTLYGHMLPYMHIC